MNRAGTVLAVLAVAGYIGFEAWAANKVKHRIEPLYIHDRWTEARQALDRCGGAEVEQVQQFDRNLVSVQRRAREDLAESNPASAPAQVTEMLAARAAERGQAVDAVVDAKGCADAEVKVWLRRFEIYAGLNLG